MLLRSSASGSRPISNFAEALVITTNPDEIERAESLLAARIRTARARAKRGEIFTRPITRAFKRALELEIDRSTWWSIMDDNPGEFDRTLNGRYPKTKPLSTMPPNILAALPGLTGDLEFRFVGRDLILRDGRANVIIDVMKHAIKCEDCE
jgi:hypothetical protein